MAKVAVFSELQDGKPKSVTLEILGRLSGQDAELVCFGELSAEGKEEAGKYGAKKCFSLSGDKLDKYSPEGYANSLKDFLSSHNYDYVFAGSTSLGKDLFPRLAGMFDAGMASEVTDFNMDGGSFKGTRPFFAGKCMADVEIDGPKPHFVTVRPNALGMPESPAGGSAEAEAVSASAGDIKAVISEIIKATSEKADLTEANIIVSGGRAMKNAENFKILDELAEVIGATVGASRAAVDSGFAPPAMQVGQTGKTVAPSLYIACGISGAIQHLAGMRTSKTIVAIDYGIVGDLFKIVPLLTEELKKLL